MLSDKTLYNLYLQKHKAKQNKGEMSKDSERLKTYKAEWAFTSANGSGIEFDTIEQVQKYVNKVTKSKTYGKLWLESYNSRKSKDFGAILRGNKISVASKKRNGSGVAGMAYVNENHIVLDVKTGMNQYTVLHELAHCIGHMHHGRSFRKDLLSLVARFMGRREADLLKAEFKKSKLACGNARKPMTFEQWVAAKNKMKKIQKNA